MRRLLSFSLAALYYFCTPAFAQDSIKKPPEIKNSDAKTFDSFKWDASIDAYHLLRSGSPAILIRYSKNGKSAFRFRLSQLTSTVLKQFLYYDSTGQSLSTPNLNFKGKGKGLNVQVGYEKRMGTGRHQFYYGIDGGFTFTSFDSRPSSILPMRQYGFILGPFVGLKYRILNRVSLSAETSFFIDYHSNVGLELDKSLISKTKVWGFAFEPLSLINISYHF